MINLDILEPITYENIQDLKTGDWIWDNKLKERLAHKRTLTNEKITEPIGFRIIDILDLESMRHGSKCFMLSNIDVYHTNRTWEYFEVDRFYKFKKENNND